MWMQEQEERDFFPQSELQNAFAQSMAEREPDDTNKINELVSMGRFVVVMDYPVYCPRTDAIMGAHKCLIGDYATREEADNEAGYRTDDPDCRVYCVGPKPVVAPVVWGDDIPF